MNINKWITRKLMTWERFEETFKPSCNEWYKYQNGTIYIKYNEMKWLIDRNKKPKFGTEIKVRKIDSENYTYEDDYWLWHELWFEPEFKPIEFIKEEEMIFK